MRQQFVIIGDQLLDFSEPEHFRSQSSFGTDPKVLQNCAGFTLCGLAGLAVEKCSAVIGLTPCMLCTDLLRVVSIGFLSAEFSTENTGLGRHIFWKPVSVQYSWRPGYHKLSIYIDYINFQPKSITFSNKLTQKIRSFKWTVYFIFHILKSHGIVFHNVLVYRPSFLRQEINTRLFVPLCFLFNYK